MGIASALIQQRLQREQVRQMYLSAKKTAHPGAYLVGVRGGQIIIYTKTRIPKVTR